MFCALIALSLAVQNGHLKTVDSLDELFRKLPDAKPTKKTKRPHLASLFADIPIEKRSHNPAANIFADLIPKRKKKAMSGGAYIPSSSDILKGRRVVVSVTDVARDPATNERYNRVDVPDSTDIKSAVELKLRSSGIPLSSVLTTATPDLHIAVSVLKVAGNPLYMIVVDGQLSSWSKSNQGNLQVIQAWTNHRFGYAGPDRSGQMVGGFCDALATEAANAYLKAQGKP